MIVEVDAVKDELRLDLRLREDMFREGERSLVWVQRLYCVRRALLLRFTWNAICFRFWQGEAKFVSLPERSRMV